MRLALPLLGDSIAPRFCSAERAWVVEVSEGEEVGRERLSLAGQSFVQRLALMRDLGVTHLLCGGFNRHYLLTAEGMGISVTWGLCGDAETNLNTFISGKPGRVALPASCGQPRRRRRRRRG